MRLRHVVAAIAATVAPLVTAVPQASATAAEAESTPLEHLSPVDAEVVDGFRPPPSPYGAGNRGLAYATEPGQPVRASAAGEVVFAGRVGLSLHVVVLHDDGIRTSYSFLDEVVVRRGQAVAGGDRVGTAGSSLHFGARAGDAYLDPRILLGQRAARRVWLVPDELRRPLAEAQERSLLRRALRGIKVLGAHAAPAALGWVAHRSSAAADLVSPVAGPGLQPVLATVREWWSERRDCTPASVPVAPLGERRIAVLVGGLGSAGGRAAILDVDTAALGYLPADVVQFSYAGGTTEEQSYEPAHTQVDIRLSGQRLRALIDRLAAERPGVPVDVLAHSQGGLVVRSALGAQAPPNLRTVVTLATPHRGADLATAGETMRWRAAGRVLLRAASELRPLGLDPTSPSVAQLAEPSAFLASLQAQPLPPGPRYVSVAARLDAVVTTPKTRLVGAEHAVVDVRLLSNAHDALPGSEAAARQLALSVTGQPLACRGLRSRLLDTATGRAISAAVDLAAGNVRIAPPRLPGSSGGDPG